MEHHHATVRPAHQGGQRGRAVLTGSDVIERKRHAMTGREGQRGGPDSRALHRVEKRARAGETALVYPAEQCEHEHAVDGGEQAVVDNKEGNGAGLRHPDEGIVRLRPQHTQHVETPHDHVFDPEEQQGREHAPAEEQHPGQRHQIRSHQHEGARRQAQVGCGGGRGRREVGWRHGRGTMQARRGGAKDLPARRRPRILPG